MIEAKVFDSVIRDLFHPITSYLDDEEVTEIMINGPNQIYIEKSGKIELTKTEFRGNEELLAAAKNIAQYVGKTLNERNPRMDARLPDGSRVHVVIPPACRNGISFAIRKFFKSTLTIEMLIGFGSISQEGADFISKSVAMKKNIVVAGGTGSGKTSLLNVVSSMIDGGERIIVIEDTSELQLEQPHVLNLEAQAGDPKGRGKVSIRNLFHSAMRLRPDRIVIGEIRGEEALDLVQAMTSGHGGCMSTTHATYPTDTMNRLETMCLMSEVKVPHFAVRAQLASAIELIVQTSRFNDGSRKITHVSEVCGLNDEDNYQINDVFVFKGTGKDKKGKIIGKLIPTGYVPTYAKEENPYGINFDLNAFNRV